MTEHQISKLVEEMNRFLSDSESSLRVTYPDAEKIAQAIDHKDEWPAFDP